MDCCQDDLLWEHRINFFGEHRIYKLKMAFRISFFLPYFASSGCNYMRKGNATITRLHGIIGVIVYLLLHERLKDVTGKFLSKSIKLTFLNEDMQTTNCQDIS